MISDEKRHNVLSTTTTNGPAPLSLIGVRARNPAALVRCIEMGFSVKALDRLAKVLGRSPRELAALLGMPSATYHRRQTGGRLTSEESDRLARLAHITSQAIRLFEDDVDAARRWLESPKPALGGATPLNFARTDPGAREVVALIERLEHGVYS